MPLPPPAEIVRLLFEASAARDHRRIRALLAPDVVATSALGPVFHGRSAVEDPFAAERAGPRTEVLAHRFVAQDDGSVVAYGRVRVLDRGALTDSPAAWRFVVRDGLVSSIAPVRGVSAGAARAA